MLVFVSQGAVSVGTGIVFSLVTTDCSCNLGMRTTLELHTILSFRRGH